MKRIALTLLLAAAASGHASGQTVVQSPGASGAASATVKLAAPAAGHTLTAIVTWFMNDTLAIPAGWKPRKIGYAPGPGTCPTFASDNLATCVLTRNFAARDPTSYTFTQSGADGISAIVYEFAGANAGIPVNAINYRRAGSGPIASFPLTPSVAGTLPIVCGQPATPTTPSAPAGWVLDQNVTGSQYHTLFCMHRTAPTTDTSTPISASIAIAPTVAFSTAIAFLIAPVPASPNPTAATSGPYFPSATIPFVFDGTPSHDPGGRPIAYAWNFGDGATATGAAPSHAYATAGNYTTHLTVTNSAGLTGATSIAVTVQVSPSVMSLGLNGNFNGWTPTPGDAWEKNVTTWPVDPHSAALIANFGSKTFHADFSSSKYGSAGIPYSVVPANQPRVPWTDTTSGACPSSFPRGLNCSGSDDTLFPFYVGMPIEGAPKDCVLGKNADQHTITLTQDGVEYDAWRVESCSTSTPRFSAANGTVWDATRSQQRPYSLTSADAGGLPILKALQKYNEAAAGVIRHAFRFTLPRFGCEYANGCYGTFIAPAIHSAPTGQSGNYYGMRLRLHPGYTNPKCTSNINRAFLTQMQTYGGIAADIGGALYVSGTPDERWPDDDVVSCYNSLHASDFDVVVDPSARLYSAVRYPRGQYPIINNFTASAATVAPGTPVTLSWDTSYASYLFIDKAGFIRGNTGSITVSPTVTTTYTLTATNNFRPIDDGTGDGGRGTASVTVTVTGSTGNPHPTGKVP